MDATVDVVFTSACASQALAAITSPVTSTDGFVTTLYQAKGCEGPDTITARATVNGSILTATGTVTVQPAEVGSLEFVSATPSHIGLKGTGLSEASTVLFRVLDRQGNPASNKTVNFSLKATTGGISLEPTSATSTPDGYVQTTVNSGTTPGSVSVIATLADNPNINAVSDGLLVSTGIADQDSLSLSVTTFNPEGYNYDGMTVTVNAWAADRFNNPVPDGTVVYFTTEGGQIEPSCTTTNGGCSVTWTSSNPRPADGRATVLAYMAGEESFLDLNGNGKFDDGDTFEDIPEPFLDRNENGQRDADEPFADYDNDGVYDDVDGLYNGLLCEHSTLCSAVRKGAYVYGDIVIVMSSSFAEVEFDPPAIVVPTGGTVPVTIRVQDINGNYMPSGTTIKVESNVATVDGRDTNHTVPNSSRKGLETLMVFLKGQNEPGTGFLDVVVETPNGNVTRARAQITVFQTTTPGGPGLPTLQLGRGIGAGFIPGELAIATASLPAGGKTTVTATLVDDSGNLYTASPVNVHFHSVCTGQLLARLDSPVASNDGFVTTTYEAMGCEGNDVITATATVNGVTITAQGSVNVASAEVGSMAFVSATPPNIGLKGTGLSESSVVLFRILDKNGNPVGNKKVKFDLNTLTGDITLDPPTAISTADGYVQTTVTAGTTPGTVSVTASYVDDPTIRTVSDGLVVSTGIADQDSFTLTVMPHNVEGFDVVGQRTTVSVYAADRFNNPVPDGTAVYFTTEGGRIDPSCMTVRGECSVTWTSQNPVPKNGRVTVLAYMAGEESFVDLNGNGRFDDGDTFTDIPEPFLDMNENGQRDSDEPFVDYDNDGTYDDVDGRFNGLLCEHSSLCSARTGTYLYGHAVIVMSTSSAQIAIDPSEITMATNTVMPVTIRVQDLNGNRMAAGTRITVASSVVTVEGRDSNFVVPDSTETGPNVLVVFLKSGNQPTNGILEVSVETPGGLVTTQLAEVSVQ